jgi:glycosyltransferase involved in cell wall biosynthesis
MGTFSTDAAPTSASRDDSTSSLVSIICAYRDASKFIPGLIVNVQSQVYTDWELLLVDDYSSDDGPKFAKEASLIDQRLRPITAGPRPAGLPDGPWWPRNQGLLHAYGTWIAFLDADDLWHPLKLQLQMGLHSKEKIDLSISGFGRFRDADRRIISWRCPPARFTYKQLLAGNLVPMLTVVVRRRLLRDGFRPVNHEDYLLWLDLFRDHPEIKIFVLPQLLAFYRLHQSNLSRRQWVVLVWVYNVYRAHQLSTPKSIMGVLFWLCYHVRLSLARLIRPIRIRLDEAILSEKPRNCPFPAWRQFEGI